MEVVRDSEDEGVVGYRKDQWRQALWQCLWERV